MLVSVKMRIKEVTMSVKKAIMRLKPQTIREITETLGLSKSTV